MRLALCLLFSRRQPTVDNFNMATISPLRRALVLVAFSVCSGLPAQSEAPEDDVIRLKNENVLQGVILGETERTVTIRVGPGQEIEVLKENIASLVHVTDAADAAEEDGAGRTQWATRDSWFRIKDADGRIVGKLHLVARPETDGTLLVEQQWTFVAGPNTVRIQRIESADGRMQPLSFLYRETVFRGGSGTVLSSGDKPTAVVPTGGKADAAKATVPEHPLAKSGQRAVRERLVRGFVRDGKLHIEETGSGGRQKRSIPFLNGNGFPLLVEESLRRGGSRGAKSFHASVYDPMEGLFELRRFILADNVPSPETLFTDGKAKPGRSRHVVWESNGRHQREWIAADGKIQLIEVNGVHVVAEPISSDTGRRLVKFDLLKGSAAWCRFAGLNLWLPRATWRFGRQRPKSGVLDLVSGITDTHVRVWHVRPAAATAVLQGVAESCLNRWKLDHPWFKESSQDLVEVGARVCVRIDGGGRTDNGPVRFGRVYVLTAPEGHLIVTGHAAAPQWAALSFELEAVVSGLRDRLPETSAASSPRR